MFQFFLIQRNCVGEYVPLSCIGIDYYFLYWSNWIFIILKINIIKWWILSEIYFINCVLIKLYSDNKNKCVLDVYFNGVYWST